MLNSSIVFADANEAVRVVAARQLTACGHKVMEASDAGAALNGLLSGNSDLIVLDFNLPDILGLDLLREIKGNTRYGEVRVLMTSDKGAST